MAGDRLARGPGTWTGGPRARRGLSLRVRLSSSVVCRLPAELLGLASKDVSLTVACGEVRRDESACTISFTRRSSLVDCLMMGPKIPQHPLCHTSISGVSRDSDRRCLTQDSCPLWTAWAILLSVRVKPGLHRAPTSHSQHLQHCPLFPRSSACPS